jgi:hypothetical protein
MKFSAGEAVILISATTPQQQRQLGAIFHIERVGLFAIDDKVRLMNRPFRVKFPFDYVIEDAKWIHCVTQSQIIKFENPDEKEIEADMEEVRAFISGIEA